MRRGLFALGLIPLVLTSLNTEASADIRRYSCSESVIAGGTVTVTAIAERMIAAGPLRGHVYKFRQSTNDPQSYLSGSYILHMSEDRSEIEIIRRDAGSIVCFYEASVSTTAWNTDVRGCPPGTQPAPQAKTCSFVLSELLANWSRQQSGKRREALQPGRPETRLPD